MKPVAHLDIRQRGGYYDWNLLVGRGVRNLTSRGTVKANEVPLERIVDISEALDHWTIEAVLVNAPGRRLVSWPKGLRPRSVVVNVLEYSVDILQFNDRLENAYLGSRAVPFGFIHCPSKRIRRIVFTIPCITSFDFLEKMQPRDKLWVQCLCFHHIPWFVPSVFLHTPTSFSPNHHDVVNLLASSRRLVSVITAGLGADQGPWTSFLLRGLYDPRLFAVIVRFLALFHCIHE
jgi:hypothetical protein